MGKDRLHNSICYFILLLLITSCSFYRNNRIPTSTTKTATLEFLVPTNEVVSYTVSIPIKTVTKLSQDEIAQILFSLWLDHFTSNSIADRYRLDNYDIQEVELPQNLQDCARNLGIESIARMEFSVQTSLYPYSDWVSGTGELGNNRWVYKKFFYIAVFKNEKDYSFKVLGSPPCDGIAIDGSPVP